MTGQGGSRTQKAGAGAEDGPGPFSHALASERSWAIRGRTIALDGPVVMGIVNLTPDSFSDGGALPDLGAALDHARALVDQGATLLDVGGESTRPGAHPVDEAEERDRVLPFVEAVGGLGVPISVDTRKASVARAAVEAGAAVVNDVSGFAHDGEMAATVARLEAGAVLMHMRGDPRTMGEWATYRRIGAEVARELEDALARACDAGIPAERVVVDPGLGFAKTAEQTLALLGDLRPVLELGHPVLVGPSRKRFIDRVSPAPPRERVAGTVSACVLAYLQGARIFRVHDVAPVVQALAVAQASLRAREEETRR